MRSAILLLSILLALPLSGSAQESAGSRTHTVSSGETLGGIAQRYLGSSGEWRRIFEANRDRISNPDLIRAGMTLVIPGGSTTVATVLGFQTNAATPVDGLSSYEARRRLLEYRPFAAFEVAEPPIETRTVFYGPMVAEGNVEVAEGEVPALPETLFRSAAWLISENEPADRLGEVTGFAEAGIRPPPSVIVHPGDFVHIRLDGGTLPRVGDEFLLYRIRREIEGVGSIAAPTGRVKVTGIEGDDAVAHVIEHFDAVRIGDFLGRSRSFPLTAGVHPSPLTNGTEARIVAFEMDQQIYGPGDLAFLDQGSDSGVKVGDELVVAGHGDGSGGGTVARFQVVGVRARAATVRMTHLETALPLRPGVLLAFDRKMP